MTLYLVLGYLRRPTVEQTGKGQRHAWPYPTNNDEVASGSYANHNDHSGPSGVKAMIFLRCSTLVKVFSYNARRIRTSTKSPDHASR